MNTEAEIEQAFADYRDTGSAAGPGPTTRPATARDRGRFARHADGRVEEPDEGDSVPSARCSRSASAVLLGLQSSSRRWSAKPDQGEQGASRRGGGVERARSLHRDGFAQGGAEVALLARRKERLVDAAKEAGSGTLAIECDVTDPGSCRAAIEEAVGGLGGIDGVVYAPAMGPLARIKDTDLDSGGGRWTSTWWARRWSRGWGSPPPGRPRARPSTCRR